MSNRMRHLFVPEYHQIPEWKQCYYDYVTLQEMSRFFTKCEQSYSRIFYNIKYYTSVESDGNEHEGLVRASLSIRKLIFQWGSHFSLLSEIQSHIFFTFALMKCTEINNKLKKYIYLIKIIPKKHNLMVILLDNLSIESYYLKQAIYFNIVKEEQICYQSQKQLNKFGEFRSEIRINRRLQRLLWESKELNIRINQLCQHFSGQYQADLYKSDSNSVKIGVKSLLAIGFTLGICLFLVSTIIFIILSAGLNLEENNEGLAKQFPMWRGGIYIIQYMMLIGLDVYIYQSTQINYRMIFSINGSHIPHAKFIWKWMVIISMVFCSLYLLDLMQFTKIIYTEYNFFGQTFWILFLASFFILPCIFRSFYYLILILEVLKSVFMPCKITFLMIWTAEQLVSLNQLFGDMFYTGCITFNFDPATCLDNIPIASSCFAIVIFIFRIIQNLKAWYQASNAKKIPSYDILAPQFLGFLRGFLSLLTTICSLLYQFEAFIGSLQFWLVFVTITTIYSSIIDIKCDWGLFDKDFNIRNKTLFPNQKGFYKVLIGLNFLFRFAWVISISSVSSVKLGFSSYLFFLGISSVELVRRGIWNILRVEFQHIKNCDALKATINDDHILDKVIQEAQQILIAQQERKKKEDMLSKVSKRNRTNSEQIGSLDYIAELPKIISQKPQSQSILQQFKYELEMGRQSLRKIKRAKQITLLRDLICRRNFQQDKIKKIKKKNESELEQILQHTKRFMISDKKIKELEQKQEIEDSKMPLREEDIKLKFI